MMRAAVAFLLLVAVPSLAVNRRLSAYGDSNTEDPSGVTGVTDPWPSNLATQLGWTYSAATNLADSGDQLSTDLQARYCTELVPSDPEVVVWFAGTNDIRTPQKTSEYLLPIYQNMLFDMCALQRWVVFIGSVPPHKGASGWSAANETERDEINAGLPTIASTLRTTYGCEVWYVDTNAALDTNADDYMDDAPVDFDDPDDLHLSQAGHDEVADTFYAAIVAQGY